MAQHAEIMGALTALASRMEALETKVAAGGAPAAPAAAGGGGGAATGDDSAALKAFDAYARENLDPFVAACDALGSPEAAACGAVVKEGWDGMRSFIAVASQSKKPANFPQACLPALKPCQDAMAKAAGAVTRGNWECHQKTVSEGLQCLSWLVVVPAPRDFIENFIGGQDFWANKIRVMYRKTDPKHVAFCDTFKALLVALMAHVKDHHTTGVAWNPKGGDLSAAAAPPPPPAPPAAAVATKAAAGGIADLKAAFAAKGNATAGLKTVTKDMQTWRSEYKGGSTAPKVPAAAKPKPVPRQQTVTKGPPKIEFMRQGLKWFVENQQKADGVVTITMDPAEGHKHTVYIATCFEATIDIKGKCKGIAVDACQKCNVLFDSAISSFEIVNSKSMKAQTRGTIPSVAIDKTDGFCMYLSKETLPITTFTTSKSSDMQVSFPDDAGEMVEAPIPEQFVHKAFLVNNKPKVTSEVSDLYSH